MSARVSMAASMLCAALLGGPWAGSLALAQAATSAQATGSLPADPWPRDVSVRNAAVLVYQPQVNSWVGNQIDMRMALALKPAGATQETFGVAFATARTLVDKAARTVAGHEGFIFWSIARVYRIEQERIFVALVNNTGDAALPAMFAGIADILYGREPVWPKPSAACRNAATCRWPKSLTAARSRWRISSTAFRATPRCILAAWCSHASP